MHAFFKTLKSLGYKLLLIFIILAAVMGFLISTTPGLYLTIKIANVLLPGHLQAEKIQGRLLGQSAFGSIHYHNHSMDLVLKNVNLKWELRQLLHHKLTINHLAVEQLQLTLPHDNTLQNKTQSSFKLPTLPLAIFLENANIHEAELIQGKTSNKVQKIQFQAQFSQDQWLIQSLNFDCKTIHFNGKLSMQPVMPYAISASLQLKNKAGTYPDIDGIFKLAGNFSRYQWQSEFKAPTSLHLNGTLKNGYELQTEAQWQHFIWPINKTTQFDSSIGHVKVAGKISNVFIELTSSINAPIHSNITISARTKAQGLSLNGLVKLAEGKLNFNLNYNHQMSPLLKGEIHADSVAFPEVSPMLKQLKMDTQFSGDTLINLALTSRLVAIYNENPLTATVNYQKQHFSGKMNLGTNQLDLNGSLNSSWQMKATLPQPQILHSTLSGLNTTIGINALLADTSKGNMELTIQPGHYQLEDETAPRLAFLGGQIHVALTPQSLHLNGLLTIDKDKRLTLNWTLPKFQLSHFSATQKLEGNVRLDVNSLNFLQSFNPEIKNTDGQLSAILATKGMLSKPIFEGKISLQNGRASLPNFGLDFHAIQLNLQSRNQHWQAQGSLASKDKILTLNGQGAFFPQATGAIHLDGDHFNLIDTPEYGIDISPKLLVEFTPSSVSVKGNILVPKAQIKPQSFSNSVSLSEDVVFEGEEKPSNPFHINTDVQLEMGDDVSLNVKGLKGFLTGAIHLHQLPQEPLNATGELNVKDGKYQAYGQDLAIDQGQLLFTGGPVLNPGIRVRAIRQFNNTTNTFAGSDQLLDFNNANLQTLDFGNKTTVGIEVTGRLTAPKIELFSIPSTLSQADILSMLLLGRPARQANKAGGQLLLAAISSMNLTSGTNGSQLVEQMKQTLGVDVNVETNPKFDQKTNQMTDKTSVVVGKSLSKRLYVSYNYGLAKTDSNVVTLSYLLNKFFSVQVDSSLTGSGIDLLYTHRKE